jgi:acyl carrier protein
MLPHPSYEPEHRIADLVHQLLNERSIARAFQFCDNLRDVGLTSLDMTNLVLSVEAEFLIRIPDRAITPDNFRSVAAIGGLVTTLLTPTIGSKQSTSTTGIGTAGRFEAGPAGEQEGQEHFSS